MVADSSPRSVPGFYDERNSLDNMAEAAARRTYQLKTRLVTATMHLDRQQSKNLALLKEQSKLSSELRSVKRRMVMIQRSAERNKDEVIRCGERMTHLERVGLSLERKKNILSDDEAVRKFVTSTGNASHDVLVSVRLALQNFLSIKDVTISLEKEHQKGHSILLDDETRQKAQIMRSERLQRSTESQRIKVVSFRRELVSTQSQLAQEKLRVRELTDALRRERPETPDLRTIEKQRTTIELLDKEIQQLKVSNLDFRTRLKMKRSSSSTINKSLTSSNSNEMERHSQAFKTLVSPQPSSLPVTPAKLIVPTGTSRSQRTLTPMIYNQQPHERHESFQECDRSQHKSFLSSPQTTLVPAKTLASPMTEVLSARNPPNTTRTLMSPMTSRLVTVPPSDEALSFFTSRSASQAPTSAAARTSIKPLSSDSSQMLTRNFATNLTGLDGFSSSPAMLAGVGTVSPEIVCNNRLAPQPTTISVQEVAKPDAASDDWSDSMS